MIERPIIFSGEMVRAILDGKKTQTRRVIWPLSLCEIYRNSMDKISLRKTEQYYCFDFHYDDGTISTAYGVRPWYFVGERLWVRETWSIDENKEIVYRLNYGTTRDDSFPPQPFHWKSPIFMPRWASRITLEIINIRVERLQDISYVDCVKEGFDKKSISPHYYSNKYFVDAFKQLWDSINANRGYSWESNPWVWVIEFKRVAGESLGEI